MRCSRRRIKVRKFPPLHITFVYEGEDRLVVMISEICLRFTISLICSGVVSVLLDQELAVCPSDQLRVMISGDAIIQPNSGQQHLQVSLRIIPTISVFSMMLLNCSKKNLRIVPLQSFLAHLGEMRQRFDFFNTPLAVVLVTSRGSRDSCSRALKMLRSCGVFVDEAYCLAGAPRGPILSVLQPHFLLNGSVSSVEE